LEAQLKANPTKVRPWYDKAMEVKRMSDSLYNYAEQLRWDIARKPTARTAHPTPSSNKEDLEAADRVMLAPVKGQGGKLYRSINS